MKKITKITALALILLWPTIGAASDAGGGVYPPQGSTGNVQVMTSGGVFGPYSGLTCASHKWVSTLDDNLTLSTDCTQPSFSDIAGTISLTQIGSAFTNGQLLIGNTSTGYMQAATLTAGSNVTITNAGGAITIAASGSGAPTGSAGGDLGGTYPNPTVLSLSHVTGGITASTPDVAITAAGSGITVGTQQIINAQGTTTPYTILSSDMGKTVTHNKSTAVAVTLPVATTTGFGVGTSFTDVNLGVGTVTITPTTSTINGNSTLALTTGQGAYIISDGANYIAFLGAATGGGSGTVTTTGSPVSGNLTAFSGTTSITGTTGATLSGAVLTLGVANTTLGDFVLEGSTSGAVTVQPAAAAGTWSLTLPTSGGTNGYLLSTNGSGVTSWVASSGTGTVTTVSVAAANGFSGTVANATTTPAITIVAGAITPSSVTSTGPVVGSAQTVSVSGAAIATNYSSGMNVYFTAANSATTTVSAPSNAVDAGNLTYIITQGTSSVIAWNAIFDFGASGAPTLSTTNGKVDYVGFKYNTNLTKWVYLGSQLGN